MNILLSLFMLLTTFPTLLFVKQGHSIKVEEAWIRIANSGMNSAGYCIIKNDGSKDDQLLYVSCSFAKMVQVHETYQDGNKMGMRKAGDIIIKGNSSFTLKPGGYHIMFIKLKENLKAGDKKELVFQFKNKGNLRVSAEVKAD